MVLCCIPVMSTLGWSVSEKDTEWKLASEVTCRGEKLMLRTATVSGEQPHTGVLSRACWATLLRVVITGMMRSVKAQDCTHVDRQIPQASAKSSVSMFWFSFREQRIF